MRQSCDLFNPRSGGWARERYYHEMVDGHWRLHLLRPRSTLSLRSVKRVASSLFVGRLRLGGLQRNEVYRLRLEPHKLFVFGPLVESPLLGALKILRSVG